MRALTENVLRNHYNAQGNDLSEQINSVRNALPSGANEGALHRLRKFANSVLHGALDNSEVLMKLDAVQIEKEIVSLLLVLRALIEGVPQWRQR